MSLFEQDGSEFEGAMRQRGNKPVGRRRRRDQEPTDTNALDDPADNEPVEPPKKAMGWGADTGTDGDAEISAPKRPGRRQGGTTTESVAESAPSKNRHDSEDEGDCIQIIPDLEEMEEDDITAQVAEAPMAGPSKLPTELDKDMKFQLPPPGADGVNLKLLYECLAPQDRIVEVDEVWDPETMLGEIKAEIQAEADKLAAEDERKDDEDLARPEAGGGVR